MSTDDKDEKFKASKKQMIGKCQDKRIGITVESE